MNSLKIFKGYGKVEVEPDQNGNIKPKSSSKHFTKTISIFALLFLTLTFASFLHHHTTNTNSQQQLLNSAESIRLVCNVTRFPDACLAAIPPSPNATNPETILALSLRASIHALQNISSSLGTANPRALADCRDLLDDALSRLNDSLSAAAAMTETTVADVQTWVGAAATDQETCLDGLEEVGDVAGVDQMKKLMKRSKVYTSNSLAIVANIPNLLRQFNLTLH